MKGSRLIVLVSLIVAVSTGTFLAILNKYGSWSDHQLTELNPLLSIILAAIQWTFLLSYSDHPKKEREITKVFKKSVRLKHGLIITAFFFLCVLVLGLNEPSETIQKLHLVATGLAITTGYITLLTYPETPKGHKYANIGAAIGLTGFILGFVLNLYSVSWAEVIVSIPLAIFIFVTYIKFRTFDKTKRYESCICNRTPSKQ